MNHRVNAVIHVVSACYWALASAVIFLLGPHPFSPRQFGIWVTGGIVLIGFDLLAGVRQWRSPATGRRLSVVCHFVVTIFVVSLMTVEFLQAQPRSFFAWFKAHDYWFLATLGFIRLLIGTALLMGNKDVR